VFDSNKNCSKKILHCSFYILLHISKFDCRLQKQFFIRYELQAQVTIAPFKHQHKESLHKCTNNLTTYNCTNKPQKTKLNLLHPNACIKCRSQWKENKMIKDDMVALAPDTTNEKGNDAYIAHTQHMDRWEKQWWWNESNEVNRERIKSPWQPIIFYHQCDH